MADGARVEPAAAHENHVRSDKVSETWRKAHRLYTSPALSAPFNINTSLIFFRGFNSPEKLQKIHNVIS
jgi:hypothetical protein